MSEEVEGGGVQNSDPDPTLDIFEVSLHYFSLDNKYQKKKILEGSF